MRSPFRAMRACAWTHTGASGAWRELQNAHTRSRLARRARAAARARHCRRPHLALPDGSANHPFAGPDWSPFLSLHVREADRRLSEAHRARPSMSRCVARRSSSRLHLDLHANGSRHGDVRARLPADATYHWDLYVVSAERGNGVGTALAFARLHHVARTILSDRLEAHRHRQRRSQRDVQKTARPSTRVIGELRYVNFRPLVVVDSRSGL